MKSVTVILLSALVVLCSGHYMTKQVRYADRDSLVRQKFVFDILQHVHQDDGLVHEYDQYKNYNIRDHYDAYNQPEQVQEFVNYYYQHPVPVTEIFNIFDEQHKKYARGLVQALYLAKDYETYKKTAVWARFHCNKRLFVYAFHVATLARPDMQGIVFPAIYEIYPYYFFNSETIQKAQYYKLQGFQGVKKVEDVYTVAIQTNYTGVYGHVNHDNLLSYFTEDVSLNAFYYYYNLDYPYWTTGQEQAQLRNDYRGSFYLYLHWQLLARYYLERLSHNLGEIEEFNWHSKMHPGYHTGLRYYNGVQFPNRDNDYSFHNTENYELIDFAHNYDDRIMESIDLERVVKSDHSVYNFGKVVENIEILGNLIQGNEDSYNKKYYGNIDKQLREIINEGIPYGKYEKVLPGVLMHYETSLRDPAFYQMYKRILRYYWHYLDQVPPYTQKDLGFDGVKIDGVEVDRLVTYYDRYDSDITNAVDVEPYSREVTSTVGKFGWLAQYQQQSFIIKARQHRLNHLPFTVKVTVNSNKAQKAVVKYFLGPKYDSYGHRIQLQDNRQNFIELEHYLVDLNAGKNVLTRSSDDFSWYINDRTTYYELYKKLMTATNTESYKFPLDMSEAHCGFPNRLMLPRGKKGGMPFQLFVIVMPYNEPKVPQFTGYDPVVSCGIGSGGRYVDNTPFGYPFDRRVDTSCWNVDNIYFKDVVIYQKTEGEVNAILH